MTEWLGTSHMGCCENPVYSHRCPKLMLRVCYVNYFRTRESVSRYKRPLRLCMSNKILRSANAKYHYYFWRNCRIPWICGLAVIPLMRLSRFTKTMNSSHKHRNISKVSLLYLFCRKTVKIMIFSIRTPQYFIFHYYKLSKVVCNATPALLWQSKLYFFLHWRICRFVTKSLDRTKKVKRKSLYDSEVNKPMTLRSGKRRSLELTHNKSMEERETMYKLRPRKRKTVTN